MSKIVFLMRSSPFEKGGGAEIQTLYISKYLENLGHKCIHIHESKDYEQGYNNVIMPTYPLPYKKNKPLLKISNYFHLKSILDDINPEYIYQRCRSQYTFLSALYCKRRNTKMIWAAASDRNFRKKLDLNSFKSIPKMISWKLSGWGMKNADKIIVQTIHQQKLLKKRFGLDSIVIPNSHEVPDPPFEKEEPPLVAWIANIKKWKRPKLFVKIARKLERSDVKFIMVGRPDRGNPEYQNKLESEIEKTENITYLGEVPFEKTNEILSKASLFVNTSLPREGFPNTYIQAWMREVPVLTLAFDPDDIIKRHGLGYQDENIITLTNKIRYLTENIEEIRSMGRTCRKFAIKNYDIERNVVRYEELFREL